MTKHELIGIGQAFSTNTTLKVSLTTPTWTNYYWLELFRALVHTLIMSLTFSSTSLYW